MTEADRLRNELNAAVEHAKDLIWQRNEARDLKDRLLTALSSESGNLQGIRTWILEEHGSIETWQINAVLEAIRWRAGLK